MILIDTILCTKPSYVLKTIYYAQCVVHCLLDLFMFLRFFCYMFCVFFCEEYGRLVANTRKVIKV